MTEKQFQKDEVIFHQGDQGESLFRILEGSVGIFVNYQEPEEKKLTELSGDQIFGEMAIIESYPRSATAVALSDGTKVQEASADELSSFLKQDPNQILTLIRFLSDRLRDLTDDYNDVCGVIRELSESGKKEDDANDGNSLAGRIRNHIEARKARKNAPDTVTAEYLNDLKELNHTESFYKKVQTYPKGTVICREGKTVHCMYDIYEGRVGVYTGFGTENQELLAQLFPDSFFGEAGMISDEPRSATVVALEDTTVEIIYREDLEGLVRENPAKVVLILRHLSYRIRMLTSRYMDACELVSMAREEKESSGKISPQLFQKLNAYKTQPYN